jgi:hypothetical protein
MRDLNDLLPAAAGWHLRTAADVNDAGHVVAVGVGAIGDSEHAFLLSPLAPGGLPRTGGAAA